MAAGVKTEGLPLEPMMCEEREERRSRAVVAEEEEEEEREGEGEEVAGF